MTSANTTIANQEGPTTMARARDSPFSVEAPNPSPRRRRIPPTTTTMVMKCATTTGPTTSASLKTIASTNLTPSHPPSHRKRKDSTLSPNLKRAANTDLPSTHATRLSSASPLSAVGALRGANNSVSAVRLHERKITSLIHAHPHRHPRA